uniref:Secreted protein n=1 Tax=Salix viminalis TaxID=40686 RepID=A0A6N2MPS0_SALVM
MVKSLTGCFASFMILVLILNRTCSCHKILFIYCGHIITAENVDTEKAKASSEIAGYCFVKHALLVEVRHPFYLAYYYTDSEFH